MKNKKRISSAEFEQIVAEALESLPDEFQELLENITVVIEEEPSQDDLDEHEIDGDDELLGSFRGVPRTEVTAGMLPTLPNRIAIFRGPILRIALSRHKAMNEIRSTLIHELGHYFGLDDAGMPF